jgi:hypothetical protein
MTRRLSACAVAAALLALHAEPSAAQKGKTPPNPTVAVTIEDEPNGVASDGLGPYAHGQGGVEAQIWASGSQDVTLRLPDTSPRRYRVLGALDGWFMNVRNIGAMPISSTKLTEASVATDHHWYRWCGPATAPATTVTSNCTFDRPAPASSLVSVTRDTQFSWTVTTFAAAPAGDVTVVLEPFRNVLRPTGETAILPLRLKVECIANCQNLQP